MVAGLRAAGLGRMDEILIPPYMCGAVLSALYRTCFPSMTPSGRTKAVFVYHQFGFPQKLSGIEKLAQEKGWVILNDCANTVFTRVGGKLLVEWGDFSIISLAKLYPCGLGGGFYSQQPNLRKIVCAEHQRVAGRQAERADQALEKLININNGLFKDETVFEIHGLYGYLPELAAFPQKACSALPSTEKEIKKDIARRKNIWSLVKGMLPARVPICDEGDEVVPFAIPVSGDPSDLEKMSNKIKKKLSLDAPVLHFDFSRNMLKPDYRK
ncbi:MAG: DegT/DnrJ/EryC1/StrS family aminotransferase, partial [bacterium]